MTCRLTDTDVIVVSSEDSGKTFVYVFFLLDSQECPSGRVFTQRSTIVFAPALGSLQIDDFFLDDDF